MTEKQTFSNEPAQNTRPENTPNDEQIDLFVDVMKDWVPTDAAKRILAQEPIPQSAPRPRAEVRRASTLTSTSERSPIKTSTPTRRIVAGAIGAALAGGAAYAALSAESGGSNNPERGELDTQIVAATLLDGARIRQDPFVEGQYETPNILKQVDGTTHFSTPDGVRIERSTNNGTWYGFEASQIPDLGDVNDKDGIVWVNEQKVSLDLDSNAHSDSDNHVIATEATPEQ